MNTFEKKLAAAQLPDLTVETEASAHGAANVVAATPAIAAGGVVTCAVAAFVTEEVVGN